MGQRQLRIGWQSSAVELSFGEAARDENAMDAMDGLRFCVIGEQAHGRNTIRHIFQSVGIWSVSEQRSCDGAMAALAERRYDAIVLDVGTDQVDWRAFVSALRVHQRAELAELPIILITAVAEAGEIEEIRDLGVNAILLKPFSAKGLMMRVRKALDRSGAFIRGAAYTGPCRRVRSGAAGHGCPERRAA